MAQEITVPDRLNKIIHPISTLRPDSSFDDINFLHNLLDNKEVIALGEVTHGTREVSAYKDRLIRYLVSNLNYKTIVFEADYSGMVVLDNYINGKADRAGMSPHYISLFEWLRNYNNSAGVEEKVHVYGMEIRDLNPAIDRILSENDRLSAEDKVIFQEIRNTPYDHITKKQLAQLRIACLHLPELIQNKMLIQLIDNYDRFIGKKKQKIGERDAYMAQNVVAIRESTKNKKMIIWAHNGHVAKTSLYNEPAMGKYLMENFHDKYYVIATDINKGTVSVRKFIAKNKPVSDWQSLAYTEVDSDKAYENYFKQCQFKNFILDVQTAKKDAVLNSFLTEPKEMRMIGALSVPVNKKLSIADNFDMIVYFNESNSL